MDFLEIRRKAKQRAEARARAEAPARADGTALDAIPDLPEVDARAHARSEVAAEGERCLAPAPELVPVWSGEPGPPPVAGAAIIEPFEAVLQAVEAAGGELTPIPDLPDEQERDPPALHRDRSVADTAAAPRRQPAADPLDEFFYREGESAPELPDFHFDAPARAAEVEVVDPLREYLTFLLGDEEYAIDIERVREVLKAPVITDVPRAPEHVLGVIMVRGDVIAVFDPRRRLGLPPVDRAPTPRVVVCDDGLGPIGLLVDSVSQVVRLRRSEIEARPQGIGGVSADYISGIGRQAGRMFIVLELPVVLRGRITESAEAAS